MSITMTKIGVLFFYLDVYNDDLICNLSETALRSHLDNILSSIRVEDYKSYSWHSFRRGGAYLCGCNGISDSTIKAHGRWKSDAYIRYVSVEMPKAGRDFADVFAQV